MRWIVTDTTCGHTVVTAAARAHAEHHARLADLAGYPTTLEEWETPPAPDDGPPADCARCWGRVDATLHLMNRARVAEAAEQAGADPFTAVHAYDRLQARQPHLTHTEAADIVCSGAASVIAPDAPLTPFDPDALDPAMFATPSPPGPS